VISGDRTHEKRVYWNPTAVKLEEADRLSGHDKTVKEVGILTHESFALDLSFLSDELVVWIIFQMATSRRC
jgi:hypothetical protein